jgi:hypothetical protein
MYAYPSSHKLACCGEKISHAHKENQPAVDIPQDRKSQKGNKYK